jgi:hypothetical protein
MHRKRAIVLVWAAIFAGSAVPLRGQEAAKTANWPEPQQGDYVVRDFHFQSGENLAKYGSTTTRSASR